MTLKGISNVQDGVKKITGISIASAGQLIVRGLGDRVQHDHPERFAHRLAQPGQQADSARPLPGLYRKEHHRQ